VVRRPVAVPDGPARGPVERHAQVRRHRPSSTPTGTTRRSWRVTSWNRCRSWRRSSRETSSSRPLRRDERHEAHASRRDEDPWRGHHVPRVRASPGRV